MTAITCPPPSAALTRPPAFRTTCCVSPAISLIEITCDLSPPDNDLLCRASSGSRSDLARPCTCGGRHAQVQSVADGLSYHAAEGMAARPEQSSFWRVVTRHTQTD